jgi:hypothetical protein
VSVLHPDQRQAPVGGGRDHHQALPAVMVDTGRVAGMLEALIVLDDDTENLAKMTPPFPGRSGAPLLVLGFAC